MVYCTELKIKIMQYTTTTTPNIIGDEVGIQATGLDYTNTGHYHYLECNNLDNHKKIMEKCNKIAKLVKEIEELNK